MMFTDIIYCFLANVILGIATLRCGFKDNGMPGVLYTLLAVSASVFWTVSGICFLHFENNCRGQMGFFAWTAMPCLPWIFLCRKKYKISKPYFLRLGIAGILTQAAFLAKKSPDILIQPEISISPSPYRKLSKNCNPQL